MFVAEEAQRAPGCAVQNTDEQAAQALTNNQALPPNRVQGTLNRVNAIQLTGHTIVNSFVQMQVILFLCFFRQAFLPLLSI